MRYNTPIPAFIGGYTPLTILAFLLGILGYFSLPHEPRLGELLVVSTSIGALGGLAVFSGGRAWLWYGGWCLLFLACAGLGATYGTYRTSLISPDFWPAERTQRVWVTGEAREINLRANGFATVHLEGVTTYGHGKPETWPKMVVITHNSRAEEAMPGGLVSAQVRLRPPQAPLHPDQPDWRRNSFFEGVSATGLVMGDFYTTKPFKTQFGENIRATREDIARSYIREKGDAAGGVGAALLTGIRSGIPPKTRENYSQSGLAHLMAISGMHLGMVAGFVYVLLRFLLVRAGNLALYTDIRKPAALASFLAAGGYALLAGATIPTLRALALIGAALLAILFDRLHLGVRILAFIALMLALYAPYWVAGPSFQLSFVASFALLLWAYRQREARLQMGSLAPRPGRVGSVFKASLVAALATAPVVAMHFGQVPLLGVFANVLGVPLLGLVILPLGFLSLLPLGVGQLVKPFYLKATDALNHLATFVAAQPASTLEIPPEAMPFVFICAWGLLLAYIFRSGRLLVVGGLAVLPMGVALQSSVAPVLLVYQTGEIVATPSGYKVFAYNNPETRALENVAENLSPPDGLTIVCDRHFCSYKNQKGEVMLTYTKPWASLSQEDCRKSARVFARHTALCQRKNIFKNIDALTAPEGMAQVKMYSTAIELIPFQPEGNRPWHQAP